MVGGSTITQQLAKNLFLSGERTPLRKAQEFVLTLTLEALLGKRRILEIYLNNVEWGEGLFGAQAAARHYYRVDASQLGAYPAARLAVMLPAPKRFEKRPGSPYVAGRAAMVVARMSCGRVAVRTQTAELAAAAARLVVEEGLEYAAAKRKAARARPHGRVGLPSNESVENEVRAYLALFCSDTQPAELRALRRLALRWMTAAGRVSPAPGRSRLARHGDAPVEPAPGPVLRRSRRRWRSH